MLFCPIVPILNTGLVSFLISLKYIFKKLFWLAINFWGNYIKVNTVVLITNSHFNSPRMTPKRTNICIYKNVHSMLNYIISPFFWENQLLQIKSNDKQYVLNVELHQFFHKVRLKIVKCLFWKYLYLNIILSLYVNNILLNT